MRLVNYSKSYRVTSIAAAVSVIAAGMVLSVAPVASAQSRPPVNSGATGGANPGNGGSGYNPGNNGGGGYNPGNNSGGSYNPGNNGGGGYNPGNSGGSGYNPGNGGSGYNPGNGGGYNPGYNPGNNGRRSALVYRDRYYGGGSIRLWGEVGNLDNSGFNDKISSMRLQGTWLACTDAGFRGRCVTFTGNVRDLYSSGMSDQISSLRPLP